MRALNAAVLGGYSDLKIGFGLALISSDFLVRNAFDDRKQGFVVQRFGEKSDCAADRRLITKISSLTTSHHNHRDIPGLI